MIRLQGPAGKNTTHCMIRKGDNMPGPETPFATAILPLDDAERHDNAVPREIASWTGFDINQTLETLAKCCHDGMGPQVEARRKWGNDSWFFSAQRETLDKLMREFNAKNQRYWLVVNTSLIIDQYIETTVGLYYKREGTVMYKRNTMKFIFDFDEYQQFVPAPMNHVAIEVVPEQIKGIVQDMQSSLELITL